EFVFDARAERSRLPVDQNGPVRKAWRHPYILRDCRMQIEMPVELQIPDADKIRWMPGISAIMPCRNEEAFLAGTLGSLVPQLGPSDELLVVDGRSGDRSREIVAAWSSKDSRIRLLDNPDLHAAAAMNRGIQASRGEIVVRVDAHCVYPND